MNGFLAGDIDAAQAMTYNEYAQVLETEEPEDRAALPARATSTSSTGTRSAPRCCRTPSGPTPTSWPATPPTPDQTTKFIKASIKGWVYARDNPEEAAKIVTAAGSHARREPPAVDDQRGQQADLAVDQRRHRHDRRRGLGARPSTSPRAPRTRPARRSSPRSRRRRRRPTTYVEKALTELQGRGGRRRRQGVQAADVTLKEGGN